MRWWTLALLDMTGVKRAASEAIAGVDSILVAVTILFTVGGVRFIPRLRVERTGSSFPRGAVLGKDIGVEEVLCKNGLVLEKKRRTCSI